MKKIYLIRHAESEANAAMDLDNPTYYYDARITKKGEGQALKTREKLININFDTYKPYRRRYYTDYVGTAPLLFRNVQQILRLELWQGDDYREIGAAEARIHLPEDVRAMSGSIVISPGNGTAATMTMGTGTNQWRNDFDSTTTAQNLADLFNKEDRVSKATVEFAPAFQLEGSTANVGIHNEFLASANADLGTGKVKITDSSDNEIALFERAASAVNEYSFTNAATGSNPTMAATGDDTNISVALTPKGNGLVVVPNGYESNVGSVDDALVTRRWVLDNVVSAVDDLIIRKAVADDGNSTNTLGTMPNAASTTYYVTRILINVTEAFSGGSFSSMKINDGTTDLAGVNDTDLGTVGSYIVDLDAATATAGGATLTLSYLQSNGSTASTPTAGACTVAVEYKAAQ